MKEQDIRHQQLVLHQKALILENVRAQEDERKRIAQVVHDDIGNKLNILGIWLNNPATWGSERAKEIVATQLPELITSVRNVAHELYPVHLEYYGMITTLEALAANMTDELKIELIVWPIYRNQTRSIELQLYRVIQEFLNNVIKHAKASCMRIQIRDSVSGLTILLTDNGIGFDYTLKQSGMGIRSIETRIRSIDARFKWKSIAGRGIRLIISIPKYE